MGTNVYRLFIGGLYFVDFSIEDISGAPIITSTMLFPDDFLGWISQTQLKLATELVWCIVGQIN